MNPICNEFLGPRRNGIVRFYLRCDVTHETPNEDHRRRLDDAAGGGGSRVDHEDGFLGHREVSLDHGHSAGARRPQVSVGVALEEHLAVVVVAVVAAVHVGTRTVAVAGRRQLGHGPRRRRALLRRRRHRDRRVGRRWHLDALLVAVQSLVDVVPATTMLHFIYSHPSELFNTTLASPPSCGGKALLTVHLGFN